MNTTEEALFDSYCVPILKELDHFPFQEVEELLDTLPLDQTRRIDLFDQARRYFFQWSVDAFTVGLHLGLSLSSNNYIRRHRPKEGQ